MDVFLVVEIIAVVFGIISVYLLTRENIWAWPAGLITVTLYLFIFLESKLYSDAILHFIYILLNAYGWWNWHPKTPSDDHLKVSRLFKSEIVIWISFILLATVVWGFFMDTNTDTDFAYPDAFTTVASLCAQYLLTRKKIDNWVLWIIVDVVAINIYLLKGLYFTSGLYAIYLGLCILGLRDWRRSMIAAQ